ncbi:SseB family protein [Ruania alba]|uniref:SseB protein N-terminal domain-containing protein n=1 Tax=Ruania alba TaxID=648782 RepID=A0A1H5EC37_9MICO|nr:SseB family protein [Ruania alba]SED88610.1 SseB protein N-terminal domain-containing protein [Ruania alba]
MIGPVPGSEGGGRSLPPTSPFAGDDGAAPEALALALSMGEPAERVRAVVGALAGVRVLVPVVAELEERDELGVHGVAGEKSASAAMVTVEAPDGRAAIPVFSGMDTLTRWRADARPIPVEGPRAALAAASDADGLLVLDPGGPVTVLLPRPAVWALAQQRDWVPAAQDPDVGDAVQRAVGALEQVAAVRVEPGERAELRVVLGLAPGLAREQVSEIVTRAGQVLAMEELVAERVDSLEFQVRHVEAPPS